MGLLRRLEHAVGEAFAWIAAKLIHASVWMLNWRINRKSGRRGGANLVRAAKRQDAERKRRYRRAVWDSHFGGYA